MATFKKRKIGNAHFLTITLNTYKHLLCIAA